MTELEYTPTEYEEFQHVRTEYQSGYYESIFDVLDNLYGLHRNEENYELGERLFDKVNKIDSKIEQEYFVKALLDEVKFTVKEEPKFLLQSSLDVIGVGNYLNYSEDENNYSLASDHQDYRYKTQFTQSEIDKIIIDHPEVKYFKGIPV